VRATWPRRIAFWFLRHLILLTLLGLAAWGYLWRDALLPEWFANEPGPAPGDGEGVSASALPTRPEQPFRPVSPVGKLPEPAKAVIPVSRQLQQARRAYWTEGAESAEPLYRQIIAGHPAAPDAYGELGNLLLAQGRITEARALFGKAVGLLELEGRSAEAGQLRRYLGHGNGVAPKGASNQ